MKEKKTFSLDIISRYRNYIYGIGALWVALSHIADYLVIDFDRFGKYKFPVYYTFSWGNMSVDIFLLLSGISLYYAWTKNPDLKQFMISRFKRIMPVFLIITGVTGVIQLVFHIGIYPDNLLASLSTLGFWINGDRYSPWFVSCIILCYLIYPFIHKFLDSDKKGQREIRYIILMIISYSVLWGLHKYAPGYFDMVNIAISRIPAFITGCYMGKYIKEKKEVSIWWTIPTVLLFVVYIKIRFVTASEWYHYCVLLLGALPLMYIFAFIVSFLDKRKNKLVQLITNFLKLTGGVSLEFYMTHVFFYRITVEPVTSLYMRSRWLWVFGMISAYVLAFVVKDMVKRILEYIDNKKIKIH